MDVRVFVHVPVHVRVHVASLRVYVIALVLCGCSPSHWRGACRSPLVYPVLPHCIPLDSPEGQLGFWGSEEVGQSALLKQESLLASKVQRKDVSVLQTGTIPITLQMMTSSCGLVDNIKSNHNNNNYTFSVRRLGVHRDDLMTTR
jgi:hypothetical protein